MPGNKAMSGMRVNQNNKVVYQKTEHKVAKNLHKAKGNYRVRCCVRSVCVCNHKSAVKLLSQLTHFKQF